MILPAVSERAADTNNAIMIVSLRFPSSVPSYRSSVSYICTAYVIEVF